MFFKGVYLSDINIVFIFYSSDEYNNITLKRNEYALYNGRFKSTNDELEFNGELVHQLNKIFKHLAGPVLFLKYNFFEHQDLIDLIVSECKDTPFLIHYFDRWISKDPSIIEFQVNQMMTFFSFGFYFPNEIVLPELWTYKNYSLIWMHQFYVDLNATVFQLPVIPLTFESLLMFNNELYNGMFKLKDLLGIGNEFNHIEQQLKNGLDIEKRKVCDDIASTFYIIYCASDIEYADAFQALSDTNQQGIIFNAGSDSKVSKTITTTLTDQSPLSIVPSIKEVSDDYDSICLVIQWHNQLIDDLFVDESFLITTHATGFFGDVFNQLMSLYITKGLISNDIFETMCLMAVKVPKSEFVNASAVFFLRDILSIISVLDFNIKKTISLEWEDIKYSHLGISTLVNFLNGIYIIDQFKCSVFELVKELDSSGSSIKNTELNKSEFLEKTMNDSIVYINQSIYVLGAKQVLSEIENMLNPNYERIVFD